MRELITIEQRAQWVACVQQCVNYDFYHSWTYHELHKKEGVPLLFVYHHVRHFIALALIKRAIPGTRCFDMTSVYGYGGPISNREFEALDPDLVLDFKDSFLLFLKEEQIVSVFSRLHPLFNQRVIMDHFEGVTENGKVVCLDLTLALNAQREQYQERAQRKIKQLRARGYTVSEGRTRKDIQVFAEIYYNNMVRLRASEYYFFDEDYFAQLLSATEYDARLLFVNNEAGDPVCGAIVVFTNGIIQSHLLGTKMAYRSESPAKLLIDEITLMGRELGMKHYNLGGGLNYREDSLYEWKKGFSKKTYDYYSWRMVADQVAYDRFVDQAGIDADSAVDFFPLYRSKRETTAV